jgi:hypothetical protein
MSQIERLSISYLFALFCYRTWNGLKFRKEERNKEEMKRRAEKAASQKLKT